MLAGRRGHLHNDGTYPACPEDSDVSTIDQVE